MATLIAKTSPIPHKLVVSSADLIPLQHNVHLSVDVVELNLQYPQRILSLCDKPAKESTSVPSRRLAVSSADLIPLRRLTATVNVLPYD